MSTESPSHVPGAKPDPLKALEQAEKLRATARFERALLELENGKFLILQNREFTQRLGAFVHSQYVEGKREQAENLINRLIECFLQHQHSDTVVSVLNDIEQKTAERSNIGLMRFLCSRYAFLYSEKAEKVILNQQTCDFLVQSASLFIRSSLWQDFEKLTDLLWKVRNITKKTDTGVTTPYKGIFKKIATKDVIEKILFLYKSNDEEKQKLAYKVLEQFGEEAITYLLNRLIFSGNREERLQIIQLLQNFGEELVRKIRSFMEEDLPWYAIRNLILLVADVGNPEHYPLVEGYLVHPDERVQQQVVSCIIKLGGRSLPKRLVQALPIVDDEIKLRLIMQLGKFAQEEIANGLIDLLRQRKTFSDGVRSELIFRICVTLRSYPYPQVVEALHILLKETSTKTGSEGKIRIAAQETINLLEPKIRHNLREDRESLNSLSFDDEISGKSVSRENIDEFIMEIEEMIGEGQIEKASALMYKKTIEAARTKNFDVAETLRDKLLEVNPDSLQDVITAAEIIEQEKNSTGVSLQIDLWDDLFEKLSNPEYRYLMGCLKNENYQEGEQIAVSGQIDPCLYFFGSGSATLSCQTGKHETFLKKIKPGDVIGFEQFFSASVWTVGMVATQRSQVQVIHRKDFARDLHQHPRLEEKLTAYLQHKHDVRDLIKMSGRDRRDAARYPVKVNVTNVLLDPYGGAEGRRVFKGEMIDISRGGLAFSIKISNRESANLLLGRQIISEIQLRNNSVMKSFGMIVGVRSVNSAGKEYSVHTKFYSEISQQKVTEVLNLVI